MAVGRLNLTRPLVFLDLETTHKAVHEARIVEIGVYKQMPDGEVVTRSRFIHPGIPIPPDATAVHGITDQMVADAKPFSAIARSLMDFLGDSDWGGYNILNYDLPVLWHEFRRCNIPFDYNRRVIDPCRVFHKRERRTLSDALRFYRGKELDGAHRAAADAQAAFEVMVGQLDRYADLSADLDALSEYCEWDAAHYDPDGFFGYDKERGLIFRRSKHRDKSVEDVWRSTPDYFDWMLYKATDFKPETLALLRKELDRIRGRAVAA
jgi:DNA polymerase-3 subunit epsilon